MPNFEQHKLALKSQRQKWPQRRKFWLRSRLLLLLLFLCWGLTLGAGIAKAIAPSGESDSYLPLNHIAQSDPLDSYSERYQLARDVYQENCSSCHIPIHPSVLPTETWQEILEKPEKHYGEPLPNIVSVSVVLIWEYLRTFSRPLLPGEVKPVFVEQSRYFRALHPRVDLPEPLSSKSCIVCHPGAKELDYRSLTPKWESGP